MAWASARDLVHPMRLFTNRSVAPLLISRVISSASVGFGQFALTWGVLGMGYGPRELSLVLACNAFPALLIIAGGLAGDRFRRHRVLTCAELLACTTWLAMALALTQDRAPLPLLCALAAIGGAATAMFLPTLRGIITDLLDADDHAAGNALINQTQSIGLLIGLATSGLLVTLLGPVWTATTRAALCGASALLLNRLDTRPPRRAHRGTLPDLRIGWREFTRYPWVWIMTAQYTAVTTAIVCYAKIAGPLHLNHANGGPAAWGIITACEPLGALVGSLLGARWKPTRLPLITVLLPSSAALPMLALAADLSWPLIAAAALIPGALQAVYYVFWTTALQHTIAPDLLIRVNSWNMVTSHTLMPIIVLMAGFLTAQAGPQLLALNAAILTITATALTLTLLTKTIRTKPRAPRHRTPEMSR